MRVLYYRLQATQSVEFVLPVVIPISLYGTPAAKSLSLNKSSLYYSIEVFANYLLSH